MDWLKHVPDGDLIDIAEAGLNNVKDAVLEYRAAKANLRVDPKNAAGQLRWKEANKYLREKLDAYDAYAAELRSRGLKE